jgi:hypothetical protein
MAAIQVKLPEPVATRLRKEAQRTHRSVAELVVQSLHRDFPCVVRTAAQAQRAVQQWLRDPVGPLLRLGTPTFDATTEQWRVPVHPLARQGHPRAVGEVCLSAETGDILTPAEVQWEWAQQAAAALGVEALPEDLQARLEELMTRHSAGRISPEERQELATLVAQWETQSLENARRLVENLPLPPTRRAEAEARERQVQHLLAPSLSSSGSRL